MRTRRATIRTGLLSAAELVAAGGPGTTKLSPLADATTTVPVTASAAVALSSSVAGRRGRLDTLRVRNELRTELAMAHGALLLASRDGGCIVMSTGRQLSLPFNGRSNGA